MIHQADTIGYLADHPIDNEFVLAGLKSGWRVQTNLYTSEEQDSQNPFIPQFDALVLDTYHFSSDITDQSVGIKMFNREFATDLTQAEFTINDIQLDEVSLTPLEVSWQNVGQSQPQMISGIVFDTDFTQTYAFMSMDPDVLNDEKFRFPLDDLELLLNGGLVGLTGSAGIGGGGLSFVGDAGLYSGLFYWPNPSQANGRNSDIFITADITELLQILLEAKLEWTDTP
jgi:hypothetical protein